jgi:hypothetical protein
MSSTHNYKFWEKGWWGETTSDDKALVIILLAIAGFVLIWGCYVAIHLFKIRKTAAQVNLSPVTHTGI